MHPNDFIPLAEETGMIIDIGNWVINNAFSFVRRLNGLGNYSLWVSINDHLCNLKLINLL